MSNFQDYRTGERERAFFGPQCFYILVEGIEDKKFYEYYIKNFIPTDKKIIIYECGSINEVLKIWKIKRLIKNQDYYYAIIDRDSIKARRLILSKSSTFNEKDFDVFLQSESTYLTDGYCLENFIFTEENITETLKEVLICLHNYQNLNEKKDEIILKIFSLLDETLAKFNEEFLKDEESSLYKRSPISYVDICGNACKDIDLEIKVINCSGDKGSLKYYDFIPRNCVHIHGKDLLIIFTCVCKKVLVDYGVNLSIENNVFTDINFARRGGLINYATKLRNLKITTLNNFVLNIV